VRIYDIDLASGERTLLREQPVLGDYHPMNVWSADWAIAPDGARVPISIIHRTGAHPCPRCCTATEPTNRAKTCAHSPAIATRPRHGARCRARAGAVSSPAIYEHGKLLQKKNTFTDLPVARHPVQTDVSRPENLVAMGGSAGGLLWGGRQHGAGPVRRDPCRGAIRRL
jgi:oligopeptidase B